MSSTEDKDLLQQITYLSRLINRHKRAATTANPSGPPSQRDLYYHKNQGLKQTASYSQSTSPYSLKKSPIPSTSSLTYTQIPQTASTPHPAPSRILVNPKFHQSFPSILAHTSTSFEPLPSPLLSVATTSTTAPTISSKPHTILVNPNFKPANGKSSVLINPKMFTLRENKVTEIPGSVELLAPASTSGIQKPDKYSIKTNRKLVRQCSPKSMELSIPSTSNTKSQQVAAGKYLLKTNRKLVRHNSTSKHVPVKTTSTLIPLGKRKLVRLTPRSVKVVKAASERIAKYSRFKKLNLKKRTPGSAMKPKSTQVSKYKYLRGVKPLTPATSKSKFRLDRRTKGVDTRLKNVKKYSLKYTSNSQSSKIFASPLRYRKLSTSSQGKKSSELSILGTKFVIDSKGKTLRRMAPSASASSSPLPLRRIHVAGVTYAAKSLTSTEYVRTNDHQTRSRVSQAKNRSISVLVNKRRKNNMPCLFFHRFGKCLRLEQGKCPRLHDPKQVAICKKFLQGRCAVVGCLMSHDVRLEKMPTCQYFLERCCTRDPCPYLHVKVNPRAPICPDFLAGYCHQSASCKKRHIHVCPDFDREGQCSRGKSCPHPHSAPKKRPMQSSDPKASSSRSSCHSSRPAPPSEEGAGRYYNSEGTSLTLPEPLVGEELITTASKKPKLGSLPSYIPI